MGRKPLPFGDPCGRAMVPTQQKPDVGLAERLPKRTVRAEEAQAGMGISDRPRDVEKVSGAGA